MSLRYLPEHRENALLALDLARKEAAHLRYTYQTLFTQSIDIAWVNQLDANQERAEDFFSARKLRNLLVHEYMSDAVLFLQALQAANEAASMLFSIVGAIAAEAKLINLE